MGLGFKGLGFRGRGGRESIMQQRNLSTHTFAIRLLQC